MNYYNEIKEWLIKVEIYDQIKDYSKNQHKVKVYFKIGQLLSEAGKEYGKNIIKQFSERLVIEVGEKYNERTLYRMRKFYEIFSNRKLTPLVSKLHWSHYIQLLSLKDSEAIVYYINLTLERNLTKRQLQQKIKNREYDKLQGGAKNTILSQNTNINDFIQNPIIIRKSSKYSEISEYVLKQFILNHLDDFLSQLGYGFSYVGNEYRIKLGSQYNYIDLLLFNYEFNCFVVMELKVTELKKEHIGQVQIYMNCIDDCLRRKDQNKTIGIILCKQGNDYIIKYCSDSRIISREYVIL